MRRLAPYSLLLLALPACDGASAGGDAGPDDLDFDGGGAGPDAAAPHSSDAGAFDASGPAADGGRMTGETEFDDAALDAAAARLACFDGEDNDGDGLFDCGDASCQRNVRSCCVGRSTTDCCAPGPEEALVGAGCAGLLASCAIPGVPFATFGSPAPIVARFDGDASEAIVPGGLDVDGGALLLRELDPRAGTLRITARIASPLEAPASGRVETVGFGFVDAGVDAGTGLSRVAPIASLVVSRTRAEVLLVIAGEVVRRWPLTTAMPVDYTLEIDPTGRVRASSIPEGIEADVPSTIDATLRAVLYGRTDNPTATTPPARLLELRVTPADCDMPAALERSAETAVPAPGEDPSWAAPHVVIGEPAVLRYVDAGGVEQVRMALVVDGAIHLAAPGAGGFTLVSRIGEPALPPPTEPWAADGVSDPALAYQADALVLYFTGWAGGLGTIGRATWSDATERFVLDGPVPGLEAGTGTGYSAIAPFDLAGVPHAVVRVDTPPTHGLGLYRMLGAAEGLARLRDPSGDVFAFDRDEVDGPAVVYSGGVYRLYFAGRRGTRWSLGLLVSDDGSAWHAPIDDAPIFAPSGRGFDALGVLDPSLDVSGGRLSVYYAGDDGQAIRIGVAVAR